ncbi:MAG: hypothetical protein HYS73_00600 [Parcubacteria group bacterium]|nr:hypothetical protein [Parcubacteria group bacterium]MBI2048957.1 hypothetical protein [Parcubacteria group bacterium]
MGRLPCHNCGQLEHFKRA